MRNACEGAELLGIVRFFFLYKGSWLLDGELHSGVLHKTVKIKKKDSVLETVAFVKSYVEASIVLGAKFVELHVIDDGKKYSIDVAVFLEHAKTVNASYNYGDWLYCPLKYWTCSEIDNSEVGMT